MNNPAFPPVQIFCTTLTVNSSPEVCTLTFGYPMQQPDGKQGIFVQACITLPLSLAKDMVRLIQGADLAPPPSGRFS